MSNAPLANDATASFKGQAYQLYIALKKCFEMTSGQKIYIERYGDVTVGGAEQIEVKQYKSPLTDNDGNFWNTLKNWMRDDFDHTAYATLILCTTQEIGEHSRFVKWNEADLDSRIKILEDIIAESEDREEKRQKLNPTQKIPESLKLQRWVIDTSRRNKLSGVTAKYLIDYKSQSPTALFSQLKDIYCKGILDCKRDDFINALLGYLIAPATIGALNWEISYTDFDSKVGDLKSQYCRDTKMFPQKYYSANLPLDTDEVESCKDHLFVEKIHDIEYPEVVPGAINEYVRASRTVLEEFRDYNIAECRYKAYEDEILASFNPRYRAAKRKISNVLDDSKTFYDVIISEESPDLLGFDRPPRAFRNGVLHMQMNDIKKSLKWRLEES